MLCARAWLRYSPRHDQEATRERDRGPRGGAGRTPAVRLGFQPGQVVQEIGYDDDVDQELREAIEGAVEGELVDEDYEDVADAVVLWFP